MSRTLVVLAQRGVEAEAAARDELNATYRRFMSEADPERKGEAGKDLIRAIFGKTPLPKIQFFSLPRPVWEHILARVEERQVSLHSSPFAGLGEIWPYAPDGDWYKDFGSFMICGSGEFPKTVRAEGMRPFGTRIE
jgi:hypothetical protein